MAASVRASTSAWVSPAARRARAPSSSEWLPPSTRCRAEGACIRRRTSSRASSGQSGSRPLHEEDGGAKREEDLGSELPPPTAQRIPEAHEGVDRLFEREVAAHARAHRLAREDHGAAPPSAGRRERLAVRVDEDRQPIRAAPPRLHVRVVERDHVAHHAEALGPRGHPRGGGWRTRAGREEHERAGHAASVMGSTRLAAILWSSPHPVGTLAVRGRVIDRGGAESLAPRPASTVNLVYRPHVNQRKTIADAARKLPGTG